MNSVSPSAAQYVGGVMQDELVDMRTQQGTFASRPSQILDPTTDTVEEPDEVDKLKSKFISAWNNVKYGWTIKTKTSFNKVSPVYILGQSFLLNNEDEVERFRLAFVSRIWTTYRKDFPQIEGTSWTTDCGWGCMLRSGQMLLAQGLLVHLMPRDWAWLDANQLTDVDFEVFRPRSPVRAVGIPIPSFASPRMPNTPEKSFASDIMARMVQKTKTECTRDKQAEPIHHSVLAWFGDQPHALFGIHELVEIGKCSGKKAGDWYGPSIVAHILRKAVAKTSLGHNLAVYVAQDCTVYKGDVTHMCDMSQSQTAYDPSNHSWKSVIILVPVRLGGEALNPAYIECVKNILKLECCIGIIGGKPKHSLYFIGFQDEQLLYLDPHYCQPVVDVTQLNFSLESFHCTSPKKMPFSRMDPSCTIGFYAKTKKDFESLCFAVCVALSSSKEKYPIFTFVDGESQDYGLEGHSSNYTSPTAHILPPRTVENSNNRRQSDEFVFL
uniref:Cysteine protease n=1 Tax=Neogobius melanostomus TaxID=47308 RepID=A0A8C6S7C3_9GOBI